MKIKCPFLGNLFPVCLALLAIGIESPRATAQGTVFTYQGKLFDGAAAANGTYDLVFTVYSSTNIVAGPITNLATAVTNGLFTVNLDFGATVFNGQALNLEIQTRTNGATAFTTLAPQQSITPAPYSIYAANAGLASDATTAATANSVAAANITGTISPTQLPANLITNTESGVNLTGTFNGNGGGLTNVPGSVPWQVVSGTNVQAAANTGYLLTNNALDTLTLPVNVNIGDTLRISGVGTNGWQIAQNNGQSILANFTGGLNLIWTPRLTVTNGLAAVASSADGTKLVAASGSFLIGSPSPTLGLTGQIYTSTNSGVDWILQPSAPASYWSGLASSADGTKLVATTAIGVIYTSTDSGVTWISQTNAGSNVRWSSVASSADGTKLAAAAGAPFYQGSTTFTGHIYTSVDSGLTWTAQPNSPVNAWTSVSSSSDGTHLIASAVQTNVFISLDSGNTWTSSPVFNAGGFITATSISADGSKLAVAGHFGSLIFFSSDDLGATWNGVATGGTAVAGQRLANSADGVKFLNGTSFNVSDYQPLFLSSDAGQTWAQQSITPSRWADVAMSADGLKLVAVGDSSITSTEADGTIWTAQEATTSGTTGLMTLQPNTVIELQYLGNGLFMPINFIGGKYTIR